MFLTHPTDSNMTYDTETAEGGSVSSAMKSDELEGKVVHQLSLKHTFIYKWKWLFLPFYIHTYLGVGGGRKVYKKFSLTWR